MCCSPVIEKGHGTGKEVHMKKITLFLCLLFLFAYFTGCTSRPSPKTAFSSFTKAMKDGNWSGVWDSLSKRSKKAFEDEGYKKMKEIVENMPPDLKKEKVSDLGVTYEELIKMNAKDFFILIMEKTNASKEFAKGSGNDEVERVQIKDTIAKLKIRGKNEVATMVLEDGAWKIEFEEN
jgi:hypothetical protein